MQQTWLECLWGGGKSAKVHFPESQCEKPHLSNKFQVLNCWAICFFGTDPWLRGAPTPHKKNLHAFTLFFITCRSENVRHIYHYLFIRAPFQMRSLAYRLLLQAAVFIQLFDSPKRASGEIPTDRASRCSLPRHPLHFQYSLLFANKKWPPSIFVWIGFVDRLQPASISGTSVICWPSLATTESHAAATSPPV